MFNRDSEAVKRAVFILFAQENMSQSFKEWKQRLFTPRSGTEVIQHVFFTRLPAGQTSNLRYVTEFTFNNYRKQIPFH